ncbi:MAG: hypothetical protein LBM98_03415 [Oscillospiraceae bacterium]|nr:hypothetical protein [Oscillospiraceae bacterium]
MIITGVWTRVAPCGGTTPPLRRHPSTAGIGVWTRVAGIRVHATHVQPSSNPRPTLVLIPSVEGCRPQAAGWFPGAVRRLCEAPVSPRYVGRYRCEAIQCREENIRTTYRRLLRQPWIASPHFNGTYRECGGGFAKTGWAKPSPVPAQCTGTVDGVTPRTARGPTPRNPRPNQRI